MGAPGARGPASTAPLAALRGSAAALLVPITFEAHTSARAGSDCVGNVLLRLHGDGGADTGWVQLQGQKESFAAGGVCVTQLVVRDVGVAQALEVCTCHVLQ